METGIREMTKTLAGLPEAKRKQVLTEELTKFAQSALEVRKEGVSALLEGICNLPEADCKKVAKSHLQCLCELPDQSRKQLLPLHAQVLNVASSKYRQLQIAAAKELIPALRPVQRGIIQQLLSQISNR